MPGCLLRRISASMYIWRWVRERSLFYSPALMLELQAHTAGLGKPSLANHKQPHLTSQFPREQCPCAGAPTMGRRAASSAPWTGPAARLRCLGHTLQASKAQWVLSLPWTLEGGVYLEWLPGATQRCRLPKMSAAHLSCLQRTHCTSLFCDCVLCVCRMSVAGTESR